MALHKNQIISLSISGITSEGNGIGRCDGMAVFVPYTVPGDQLMAKVVKVNKSYAYAIVDRFTRPSNLRVEPDCPVFGKCGGC